MQKSSEISELFVLLSVIRFESAKLCHEGLDVLELAVDRCEAHVCYLVLLLELVHNYLAYLARGDLGAERILKLGFDLGGDILRVYGTLLARLEKSGEQLVLVEKLLGAVLLGNYYLHGLNYLKGGITLLAGEAFSSAADAVSLLYMS